MGRAPWRLGTAFVAGLLLLGGVTVGAEAASAAPGRPVRDRIVVTDHTYDGSRFRLAGTAVPHTTLRILVRLKAAAPWQRVTRARVDGSGGWSTRFADPRPTGASPTRRFWIRIEQVGSTTSTQGQVSWSQTPDPVPDPAPTPEPTPEPTAEPTAEPEPEPTDDPDPGPAGASTSYSFLSVGSSGLPARWNPCRPIAYFVNPVGRPEGMQATVAEAFTRLAAVSGLTFVDGGGTGLIVGREGGITFDRGEGIYVAFADETTSPAVAGSVAGMARTMSVSGAAVPRYVAGAVVVDTGAGLYPGFAGGTSFGAVLLHELTHVLGLGHVNDPSQLMNPYAHAEGPSELQAGDRAGLQALLQGGCF